MARVRTHLVGSLPVESAEVAMREALDRLGDSVPYIPDGETGERGNYVLHLIERLAENEALEGTSVTRSLGPVELEGVEFKVRRGKRLEIPLGMLGYANDWAASLPTFRKLRDEFGRPDLRYQLGVAPSVSIAFSFFARPVSMVRAIRPLQRALRAELARAVELAGDALVVQLDAAIEQVIVARAYEVSPLLSAPLAAGLARLLAALVRDVPPPVPVGVHLCLGNPRNQRVFTPSSVGPAVQLANALARAWPSGRPLDYVHLPIVDSTDPAHYDALADLRLPPRTRVIAGLVYEDGHYANARRLRLASDRLGFTPDVACACGMGRRTPEVARELLDEMRALAEAA